ncbi:deoxynucleoside kinase [Rhodocyclus tenuis]|uniref:AAA family ATPase n=2 Tax=Rhodocyclus TaxID=1064 RepID=A0A6L5JWH7_RHOTE|nr:deoxynucleoside kinase [Rhodocyclus gracilis]MQY51737.1 AAA family ATPase [Rhodocyclus gracilis]MRD73217.1 AAA family ATPase [Rhodocyclus gracilis]NJA89002.1 deoxynucleoside kinase [Rhodocyclus gracilis]
MKKTSLARLRHIVVEGPIGAGKTSLAQRLATLTDARVVLEAPEQNPFLARFYDAPERHALATQLHFLFQRCEQQRNLVRSDDFGRQVIADYLIEKDPLFARLTLADDEYALYRQVFERVAPTPPAPDLVIYLQARPETLVARVRRRGKEAEQSISDSYLARLAESYTQFFHHYDAAPVMVVNSENLNFVDREEDFVLLVERLEAMRGAREYFNRGE